MSRLMLTIMIFAHELIGMAVPYDIYGASPRNPIEHRLFS
jgi:hypothetical protein